MSYIGNSPTQGAITGGNIVDGSIESIDLATLTNIDINSGSIDGTIIGASSAAAGTFSGLTVDGNINANGFILSDNGESLAGQDASGFYYASGFGTNNTLPILIGDNNVSIRMRTGNAPDRLKIDNNGDVSFYEDTGSDVKMLWDASAERLGIGTTSPSATLDIAADSTSAALSIRGRPSDSIGTLLFMNNANTTSYGSIQARSTDFRVNAGANIPLTFLTNGTERARLDSSGNLLVGQTAPSNDTAGMYVRPSSSSGFIADGTGALTLGRLNSDGAIANFLKDGSTVGSIGTKTGTNRYLTIGCPTGTPTGLIFDTATASIGAWNVSTNSGADNAVDLGISTRRFKDLYLSGAVKAEKNMTFGVPTRVDLAFVGNPSPDPSVYGGQTHAHEIYIEGDALGYDLVFNKKVRSGSGGAGPDEESMRIDSSGNLLVGKTTTGLVNKGAMNFAVGTGSYSGALNINHSTNNVNGSGFLNFARDQAYIGSINQVGTSGVSYNTTSDYRLKENVAPMDNASERVKALKPCRFNFISDPDSTVDGFLAHEAQEVVPEAVRGTKDAVDEDGNPEYQGIDQSKLVPLLTKALQEALTEIDSLKTRIETLENTGA